MKFPNEIKVVIPSYKRAGMLIGKDYFDYAIYVVPESQADDYLKTLGDQKRIVTVTDKIEGNIARKRNWILDNFETPLLMLDDDVRGLVTCEKGELRQKAKQKIRLTPDQAINVIINGFNLAHQWDCKFWGLNFNPDGRNYKQYKPFSLTSPILGPFSGHLNHGLRYDERVGSKDDYDFTLQILNRYKKNLRFDKYSYDCEHGMNAGGLVAFRTMEKEIEFAKIIMKKWGKDIIYYPIPPKSMTEILNGRVNVPIAGV